MPPQSEPPSSVIALIADIVRDRHRTRHAALLVFSVAFAVTLVLASVLMIIMLFGTTGAAAVGGISALATAGLTARRAVKPRRSRPNAEKNSVTDPRS